jgi:hypothetical protein
MKDYKKQGKKNRQNGAKFELLVRKDLESKGWIVAKWTNNVELPIIEKAKDNPKLLMEVFDKIKSFGKLIPAKHKFNPFNKIMSIGSGFPDFIAFTDREEFEYDTFKIFGYGKKCWNRYAIIGVECKSNGHLDKEEKEKCKWLLENKVFSKILIASKIKNGKKTEIKYEEFK